jgi:hypothetical protein
MVVHSPPVNSDTITMSTETKAFPAKVDHKSASISNTNYDQDLRKGDGALDLLQQMSGQVTVDDEKNRRLVRKIDLHVMPLICVVSGTNSVWR